MEQLVLFFLFIETVLLVYGLFFCREVFPLKLIYIGYTRILYLDYFLGNDFHYNGLVDYHFQLGYAELIYFFITHIAFLLLFTLFQRFKINMMPNKEINLPIILYIFLCIPFCFDGIEYFYNSREEIGQSVTLIKLVRRNVMFYLLPILCFNDRITFSKRVFMIFYCFVLILSKEREPLLLISVLLFFTFINYMRPLVTILGACISGVIMLYWKALYIWYSVRSYDLIESLESSRLELSRSDPMLPFITAIKVIEGEWVRVFPDFTYLTGVFWQLVRVFTSLDKPSLSEVNSIYFSNGQYGAAFSGIGEAFLNMGVLGPAFLVLGFYLFIQLISQNIGKRAALVLAAIIIFKLMRTEFSLVLKLQVFPLFIALILFRFVAKYRHTHI